jgi:hypothetical protein
MTPLTRRTQSVECGELDNHPARIKVMREDGYGGNQKRQNNSLFGVKVCAPVENNRQLFARSIAHSTSRIRRRKTLSHATSEIFVSRNFRGKEGRQFFQGLPAVDQAIGLGVNHDVKMV